MMDRRTFLAGTGAVLLAAPLAEQAAPRTAEEAAAFCKELNASASRWRDRGIPCRFDLSRVL